MKKFFGLIAIILFLSLINFQAIVFAQSLSSRELISNAKQYDGKLITYSGEVVGEVMSRGEFSWVTINDGENALGVWVKSVLAKEIKFAGNYKERGDNLEITGIFNRACANHGGDLDIHAQSLRKVSDGGVIQEKLNFDKVRLGLILSGALFLIWILILFKRK
ncbi:MAG: DNA-binding protein [Candidatus Omnitrophica bacterium]|nr:DNA-binding protein [Candidatus Omnitrophota bacterium]